MTSPHPYESLIKSVPECGDFKFFNLRDIDPERYGKLPYCIRVILESVVRNCDGFEVTKKDVEKVLNWPETSKMQTEISYKPSRVLLQDFTGVPALADLAAMRDALASLGADPAKVNPLIPTDLVIDHSVVADVASDPTALQKNEAIEFDRNLERFAFLKWGQSAFANMRVIPPGSGICHQVNLEYLSRVVMNNGKFMYPDTVVGTDSHTTMVDGLGVLAWGVGGIEAEAVMLGQPIGMLLPEVVGFELTGKLPAGSTATDLVLIVTKMLRERKVVGKFVEFHGEGCVNLTVADRATISNMSPEYGATAGFFPVDIMTSAYLRDTNRDAEHVKRCEAYLKAVGIFRENGKNDPKIVYSGASLRLDLNNVVPCVAGPKRPQDHIPLTNLKSAFVENLCKPVSFHNFEIAADKANASVDIEVKGEKVSLRHGSVVIAAITSCTNTSNPDVLFGAGVLAKNAIAKGLRVNKAVKCTLSPGSGVVQKYLEAAKLDKPLNDLGFFLAGFGCMTCIGNSGELDEKVSAAIKDNDLVAAAVLSGNRNFEGRIHPLTRANYLCSPMLVVAFALAGRVDIDFETEPIQPGTNVFLRDIWPNSEEINSCVRTYITTQMYKDVYSVITTGNDRWTKLAVPEGNLYKWGDSAYIHNPPYFAGMKAKPAALENITTAYCLVNLGDSVTTDHISPAGKIALRSPAALYLEARGVTPENYNSYGSRRGNDEVMVRGTFANIRIVNKMLKGKIGPVTVYAPTNETKPIYDAATLYMQAGASSIILAGWDYGCGSSRDWAAKGPKLQGVRAVIAQSYERIHRSNLVGMGILPLEFRANESADSLGLTGLERFSIDVSEKSVQPGSEVIVRVFDLEGKHQIMDFKTLCRIDTAVEVEYYKHGGILNFVLRKLAGLV